MRAMIEIVETYPTSMMPKGTKTLELHVEGGGDPDTLLARMKHHGGTTTMFIDRDDARMLFGWLGAWLHGAPIE